MTIAPGTGAQNSAPSKPDETLQALYDCIQTRPRPEDVAELVLAVLEEHLSRSDKATLEKAARNSIRRNSWGFSAMAADFLRPVGAQRQVKKAEELFSVPAPLSAAECLQPQKVENLLRSVAAQLAYAVGRSDFRADRLNRGARRDAGLPTEIAKKRQYNKRWRFLKRLEAKIGRMVRNQRKYDFTRYSKSALATKLAREDLARDLPTACFVAYLASRMSVRSLFTNTAQERAFDEVSAVLYRIAAASPTANWWAMAHVYPDPRVLEHLSEEMKGRLLGSWFAILRDVADLLEETWRTSTVDRATLVVRRGNDSSTWNQTAGAWNKAREHWISLLHSMGMSRLLDDMCPGKVLRFMAADVAAWHRASGGDVHPDTRVWAELPLPWDVLAGRAPCTRKMVEMACRKCGVDPAGWTGPKPPAKPVPFRPTPELVHGVAVDSPILAATLRRASWFSGRVAAPVAGVVSVERDAHGFALGATGSPGGEDA
ncbi:hypothetical protein LZC95_07915 [Pendulispora brunnea]|uniref:Uncharacterized protein n=1 Tax=Pendulispora brunnea TaxID=2905690 RepID=A0ABZ2KGR5_9BACT